MRWITRENLLLLLAAVVLAWGVQSVLTVDPTRGLKPFWHRQIPPVPIRLPELTGSFRLRPDVLNLDHYEADLARFPRTDGPLELSFRVRLPPDGILHASFLQADVGSEARPVGLGLTLDVTRASRTGLTRRDGPTSTELEHCERGPARPLPDGRWRQVVLHMGENQLEARLDGVLVARCPNSHPMMGIELESGLRRVHVDDVVVRAGDQKLLEDHFTHPFSGWPVTVGLFLGSLAGLWALRWLETRWLCRTGLPLESARLTSTLTDLPIFVLPLFLEADLKPVLLSLRLGLTEPSRLAFIFTVVTSLVLKIVHHLSRPGVGRPAAGELERSEAAESASSEAGDVSRRKTLLLAIATQVVAAMLLADGRRGLALMLWTGLLLPLAWMAFCRTYTKLSRPMLARLEVMIAGVMGSLALFKIVVVTLSRGGPGMLLTGRNGAWLPYGLGALALHQLIRLLVVNLNADRVRGANVASLVLAAMLLGTGEQAARSAYLERSLRDDRAAQVIDEFRYLDRTRTHRAFPDKYFPAAFSRRAPGTRFRIVSLGGSTTAGAYQMRDLNQFYPHKLELLLNADPAWAPAEVVNQGVGGWTTFHIRKYLEMALPELEPDLVTLYVGHNDSLTKSTMPYQAMWEDYTGERSLNTRLQRVLNQSRLYVLLKEAILLKRDGAAKTAVPVEDARANLLAIVKAVQARGGNVLLLSEAFNPDPLPLTPYFNMMEEVAHQTGAAYLDTARIMWTTNEDNLFLDDCHLTEHGHEILAQALYQYLKTNPQKFQLARAQP